MLIHKEGKKILMQWLLILLAINVESFYISAHSHSLSDICDFGFLLWNDAQFF